MIASVRCTVALLLAATAAPVVAQERPEQEDAPAPESTDKTAERAHPDADQAIIVTGVRRPSADVLGNVSVLDVDELTKDLKPSLGDTLADLPGVSSTSFGPSASRPILRGEQGERAPVLIDGISSLDLSATDPDHAVAINPITADRIEVLRGPAALLYAPSAIAGVVNVVDSRIPRKVPDKVDVSGLLNYGTAANERSGNVGINIPMASHFAAHVDGAYSKYDDLHVGGYLLSAPLRREALASDDPAVRALAGLKDKLPNTAGRTDDVAAGIAYVDGDLDIGLSYGHHDARYGVPIRFSLDPAIVPEEPTIDAHQDRVDARANVPIGGFFHLLETRGGLSRYHHSELEPAGSVGSRFYSNGGEVRADLVQTERGGWGGTTGIDFLSQDARIRGDEKYLPDSLKRDWSLFTLQTLERGPFRFEAGARVEFARLTADQDETIAEIGEEFDAVIPGIPEIGNLAFARRFAPISLSVGGNYTIGGGWKVGLSLSHSERAPSIDELYSLGPHGGSAQFLVGDPDLGIEKSNGAELSLHKTVGPVHVQGSLYYSRYSNFIYQAPTGLIADGLPVYRYDQGKARYYGFEVEGDAKFGKMAGIDWGGEIVADAVRAQITNFGNAPEIPPFRLLAGLTGSRGAFDGRVEVERVSAQHKVAPNETTTPGYTMVNASLDWHPVPSNPDVTLSLSGNNLFNVEARRHASELKDYAPLAGRDIRLSARLAF